MILVGLAERLHGLSYADAPALAQETARLAILDTVGVTIAGATAAAAVSARRALGPMAGAGRATVFGRPERTDPLSAALFNGVAAHAHDFDDCSNTMGGHPSAPVLPALWALAEARRLSGPDLLSAYVAGVEVETRLGRAVNFHHYEKGWHPTATLGTFGAAAAAAHALRLDPRRTAAALAMAASMASGLKANFGTMTKPYHVGHCARNGLAAALLAEAGMDADPGALEHPQGFFAVFDENAVDPQAVLRDWAAPLDLVEPGIAFKRHPCCASTHPAIDALLILRERHGLRPRDVEAIRSWTHPRRLRHTNRPEPASGLEAKFSVQYVLARALAQGRLRLEDFTDEAARDPDTRALMARITAEPHPQAAMESAEHFFAEVTATLRDGRTLTAAVDRPLGRDRAHPLPEGALEAKFLDCAAPLGAGRARRLRDALLALPQAEDVGALAPLLRPVDQDALETATA